MSETGANSTTWAHTNAFANGQLLTTYSATGNSQTFALNDWQGTKRVQATANGEFSMSYASLPYGDNEVTSGSGPNATAQFFTGKQRDSESGNDYFGARYYNSEFGRWLSPDWSAKVEPVPYAKIGDPQSLDLYTYLLDNPLSSVDPDGHCGVDAGQHGCVNSQDIPRHKGTEAHQQNARHSNSNSAGNASNSTATTTKDQTQQKPQPNQVVTGVADAVSLSGAVTGRADLGLVGSAISTANDPSAANITLNVLSTVPDLGEAIVASEGVAYVGGLLGKFITNQVMAPVLGAMPAKSVSDGNGHLIQNPQLMDEGTPFGIN